jgi:hypothetical protein
MNKRYIVTLTSEERHHMEQLVTRGKAAARTLLRAWTLLRPMPAPKEKPGPMSGFIRPLASVGSPSIESGRAASKTASRPPWLAGR